MKMRVIVNCAIATSLGMKQLFAGGVQFSGMAHPCRLNSPAWRVTHWNYR